MDKLYHAAKEDGAFFMDEAIHEAIRQGLTDWYEIRRICDEG